MTLLISANLWSVFGSALSQNSGSGVYKAGVYPMKRTGKVALLIASFAVAVIPFPLISQEAQTPNPSFEVVSKKPSPPNLYMRGGGPRGDRYAMSGANLRMLLQVAYNQ